MQARLAVRPIGGSTIAKWTNGWQWSTEWSLIGALVGDDGHDVMLLRIHQLAHAGDRANMFDGVSVFAIVKGEWRQRETWTAGSIAVAFRADHTQRR